MIVQKVVFITVDEARIALVDFYTDVLVNDRDNTKNLLNTGSLKDLPNIPNLSSKEVANLYSELCLGETLLQRLKDVDYVFVDLQDKDCTYIFGANASQCHPAIKKESA